MTLSLTARAAGIRLLALDVDGVMSDGSVIYRNAADDDELKAFNIKDGLGIKLLQRDGIAVAIITGRRSAIVERRARELGIDHVVQGREDKRVALREITLSLKLELEQCAYMGDDLPDLAAIVSSGIGACPGDAVAEVRQHADWVAQRSGGTGAVREFCEFLLRARGTWDGLMQEYLP